jgi:hypothetical protein
MLKKLLLNEGPRKSRFHDEKGNFVGIYKLLINGPLAFFSCLLFKVTKFQPEVPWISYSARRELKKVLNKSQIVLEFGSGMSTFWFSKRVEHIFSVEDSSKWYSKISNTLKRKNIQNVTYKLARSEQEYINFMPDDNRVFDLILIDGSYRSSCVLHILNKIKKSGIIYLDNSDKDSTVKVGDMRLAENILLNFARQSKADVKYFTDFSPTQFFAQEGMLVKLPGPIN